MSASDIREIGGLVKARRVFKGGDHVMVERRMKDVCIF